MLRLLSAQPDLPRQIQHADYYYERSSNLPKRTNSVPIHLVSLATEQINIEAFTVSLSGLSLSAISPKSFMILVLYKLLENGLFRKTRPALGSHFETRMLLSQYRSNGCFRRIPDLKAFPAKVRYGRYNNHLAASARKRPYFSQRPGSSSIESIQNLQAIINV